MPQARVLGTVTSIILLFVYRYYHYFEGFSYRKKFYNHTYIILIMSMDVRPLVKPMVMHTEIRLYDLYVRYILTSIISPGVIIAAWNIVSKNKKV